MELPGPWQSHFVLRVDFIQESTVEDPPPSLWIRPPLHRVEQQWRQSTARRAAYLSLGAGKCSAEGYDTGAAAG